MPRLREDVYAALSNIPESQHPLARRLIEGSIETRTSFARDERQKNAVIRELRKLKVQPGEPFRPSLQFAASVFLREFGDASREIVDRIKGARERWVSYTHNSVCLTEEQSPLYASVICSDSRVEAMRVMRTFIGENFIHKNVGGSIESPSDPFKLSDDAEDHIAYAMRLGVTDLVLITHGKCGCIVNANMNAYKDPQEKGIPPLEAVFRRMARRKEHITRLVETHGTDYYLNKLSFIPYVNGDAPLLAAELAHGLHSRDLAIASVKQLTPEGISPIRVSLVHMELRGINAYLYVPEADRFERLTNNRPLPPRENPLISRKTFVSEPT